MSPSKEEAAKKLNKEGLDLFNSGKFSDARNYFVNAYNNSVGEAYQVNIDRAQDALNKIEQADSLAKEGDNPLTLGNYRQAQEKFEQAYVTCSFDHSNKAGYKNKIKAVKKEWAKYKYEQANQYTEEGNFERALEKYEEAIRITNTEEEKREYTLCKEKMQNVINTLSLLESLWTEALQAEGDLENNRSEQAKDKFQLIFKISRNFPYKYDKIKWYESISSLKIEGNQCFNQGLNTQ